MRKIFPIEIFSIKNPMKRFLKASFVVIWLICSPITFIYSIGLIYQFNENGNYLAEKQREIESLKLEVQNLSNKQENLPTENIDKTEELKKEISDLQDQLNKNDFKVEFVQMEESQAKPIIEILPLGVSGKGPDEAGLYYLYCPYRYEDETRQDSKQIPNIPNYTEKIIKKFNAVIKTTTYPCPDFERMMLGTNDDNRRTIYKNGRKIAYIADPFLFQSASLRISENEKYIFGVDLDSPKKDQYVIVDLEKGKKYTLKYSGCASGEAYWDGDILQTNKLLDDSNSNLDEELDTPPVEICQWDRNGNMIFRAKIYADYEFGAPGGYFPVNSAFEKIPNSNYVYTSSRRNLSRDRKYDCYLSVQNIKDKNDYYEFGINYSHSTSPLCVDLSFDFTLTNEGKLNTIAWSQNYPEHTVSVKDK